MYSDYEKVSSLDTTFTSSDTRFTNSLEDICLYSSNQIVLFYGDNIWKYTKLVHINKLLLDYILNNSYKMFR